MWTVSAIRAFLKYYVLKILQLKKCVFFFTFFFLIIKTNDLQCHNQSKFCLKVQFSSFSGENWQFGFSVHAFHPKLWSIKHEECKTLKNGCEPPQRAIDNFQSPLKRFTSGRHKIFTTDWLWIEICQNAVWVKLVLKWQL